MRLVLPEGDGINATTCDRLLKRLADPATASRAEITLDLQAAAFLDPYGAACLCLLAEQMAGRGQRLVVVVPSGAAVQNVALHLGLVSALRIYAEVRNLPRSAGIGHGALPLQIIRSRNDVQTVLSYLLTQTEQRLGFAPGDVLDAGKVVSELCYNVVDHSQTHGWVTAQIKQNRQGQRFIALAVVDGGTGIRASLGSKYPAAAQWRHGEAISRALGGLSSRPVGGGAGLRSIEAVVRRSQGRLTIRSGDERLYFSADHQPNTSAGAFFAGTQVGISFSQKA
ncbi:MAG: ATP-binding protein [Caldilineales bacterium]|mgnify:CR=1 FL=1